VRSLILGHGVTVSNDMELADIGLPSEKTDISEEGVPDKAKTRMQTSLASGDVKVRKVLSVTYNGLLAQSGAAEIYVHYGYGPKWSKSKTLLLKQEKGGKWIGAIPLQDKTYVNFCFKDGAENWDNNNGRNWAYPPGDAKIGNGGIS
jgi:hypothetical protein